LAKLDNLKQDIILIPRHSSENRKYIPFGYLPQENIVGDTCLSVENGYFISFWNFTFIAMHFVWVKTTVVEGLKVIFDIQMRYCLQ
jgi:hypothetical protein